MEKKQVRQCRFFREGNCLKGNQCDFFHTPPPSLEKKVEIKTLIQTLDKKRPLEYLEFANAGEVSKKVVLLEKYLLQMVDRMNQTDFETLKEERKYAVAHWIFASNQMDLCSTKTLEETYSFLFEQPQVNILLNDPLVVVNNTMKVLNSVLTNESDLTSHLWCKQSTLHDWHATLQSNISLNAGILRTLDASLRDSLNLLRNILLGISNSMDFTNQIRVFRQKIRLIFATAAFATFHFLSLRPYLDGNERLARVLSVNILDAVCPMPFPLLTISCTKEKFASVTKEKDPTQVMHYLLDCAIFHSEEYLYF